MRLLQRKTNIDFLGATRRKIALLISLVIVLVSIGSLVTRSLDFGIDFTGGILLEVGYEQSANLENIRANLADAGFEDAQVQLFGTDTDVLVRLPPHEDTCGRNFAARSPPEPPASICDASSLSAHRWAANLRSAAAWR